MRVRVRLFALQRVQTGLRELELELADGASVADAWRALVADRPVLAGAEGIVRFARNGVYADEVDVLAEGDELAVIPPVAGGAADGEDGHGLRLIDLTTEPLDARRIASLLETVPTAADGAVATFVGRTRETPGTPAPGQEEEAARFAGQRVDGLEYEAFEPMAVTVLEAIADEIVERHGVRRLAIHHRIGSVAVGETSVVIVAAAPHRDAAFAACRYAIEELKARAPIWKAERFADGQVWMGAPPRPGPADPGPT
jgi:molybdopterin synthase catalytic subunit/molybdopterin converting factor small subunit